MLLHAVVQVALDPGPLGERNLLPLLDRVQVPVYAGCDWENAPLHLPSLAIVNALPNSAHVQVAMLGDLGISWPWESLHVEALAWYDHWLEGRDTGILDGPAFRYQLRKGEADGWKTAKAWPLPEIAHQELALRSDGVLGLDEGEAGQRAYMTLGAGLNRAQASKADPPSHLAWTTAPFDGDLDLLGYLELRLDATASACDTGRIVTLQDLGPDEHGIDVTSGYLRASLREVEEAASVTGQPVLPCRTPQAVPINQQVSYRIPIIGTGYRLAAGHRLRLVLASDDQDPTYPATMNFRHASVGTSSLNRIASSSRLLLPNAAGQPT